MRPKKPSPGRGWHAVGVTGVGRYRVMVSPPFVVLAQGRGGEIQQLCHFASGAGHEGPFYMEMRPKALATELMRMMAAKKGHRKRIMALKTFFRWKLP